MSEAALRYDMGDGLRRLYTCSAVALSPPVTVQSISTKGGTYAPDKRLHLSRHTSPEGRSMPCAISFSAILPAFPWCPIGAQPYKNAPCGDMTQYRLFLKNALFSRVYGLSLCRPMTLYAGFFRL